MENYHSRLRQELEDRYFYRRGIKEMQALIIALGLAMTTLLIIQLA